MGDAAARLLDFSQPLDVALLDATVAAFYGAGSNEERAAAEAVLKAVQEHPQAWSRVDAILERSGSQQSKFFALQILEEVIKYRWATLPEEQRLGVRNFVSNMIIALANDPAAAKAQRVFLHKLDAVLVHILKQDWPGRWPNFLPELCAASRTSPSLCENSMRILRLLSEEVFDFARGELTSSKTRDLKASLNTQFGEVHALCMFALAAGGGEAGAPPTHPGLVRATLDTLHAYLSWVPLVYVFESDVVNALVRLFPAPAFRSPALRCLTEVAALAVGPEHDAAFVSLLTAFMHALAPLIPPGTDVAAAYAAGSDDDKEFVLNLALFLTTFLRAHGRALEADAACRSGPLLAALDVLASASFAPDDEVFKVCLDYWHGFVPGVYAAAAGNAALAGAAAAGPLAGQAAPQAAAPPGGFDAPSHYASLLSRLRTLMIARMAKPEEVIVVEDEAGNVVREAMKDTDTLARYKTMHETLVYLAHLDHEDTEAQMQARLRAQVGAGGPGGGPGGAPGGDGGAAGRWGALNALCWAVGSIAGAMAEDQENRFLVTVIRDLLNLCEVTRGKDNKAVIAANIMYVVGQYPRFLRNHWKFLKTVVHKLFEFMHEPHPGVQDMACETFLKICGKCRRKFVVTQLGESEPFVAELLAGLADTIRDLEAHQVHMFYEAVALMIGADADAERRAAYLERLMAPPNATWAGVLSDAASDPAALTSHTHTARSVTNILATNLAVVSALGPPYAPQMARLFPELMGVYGAYSGAVSAAVRAGGPHAGRTSAVKAARGAQRAALKLIEAFVEGAADPGDLVGRYLPAMDGPVLADYAAAPPDAREPGVLGLYAAAITRLGGGGGGPGAAVGGAGTPAAGPTPGPPSAAAAELVPRVFASVFGPTLAMITANFEDYPEHRLQFFGLLRAVAAAATPALFALSADQLRLLVDAVCWAVRTPERTVADTGLHLLLDLLSAFEASPYAAPFYQAYHVRLVTEVLAVLTDTFHKPGFKLHARLLHHLIGVADPATGLAAPLWSGPDALAAAGLPPDPPPPNNAAFLAAALTRLLSTNFPNLSAGQAEAAVAGMFASRPDFGGFKEHLRDVLVLTKVVAPSDAADLGGDAAAAAAAASAAAMAAIPGMVHEGAGRPAAAAAAVTGGEGGGGMG